MQQVPGQEPLTSREEQQLVSRFLLGDEEAIRQVYQRFARPVYTLGLRLLGSSEAAEELTAAYRDEANESLERTARALGGEPARRIEYGDAATEITRVAEEDSFDVIVVGSHGSGFVKRVLLGSVSQHLLHHAPCAVLVVRARDHN